MCMDFCLDHKCFLVISMVSLSSANCGAQTCFSIEKLLDDKLQSMTSPVGAEYRQNSDSAFKSVRGPFSCSTESGAEGLSEIGTSLTNSANISSTTDDPSSLHHHRCVGEFCTQCYQTSNNFLNSMMSYDMSTQCISNINNNNTGNLIRSQGFSSHPNLPWSMIDTTSNATNIQSQDMRTHNFGLKFHNSLMQFDNLSNIASLANNYSTYSSLYSPLGQGHLGTQIGSSRIGHGGVGITSHGFPWSTARAAGFLTSRCAGKCTEHYNNNKHFFLTLFFSFCKSDIENNTCIQTNNMNAETKIIFFLGQESRKISQNSCFNRF